jgi:hypothetical protein
MPPSWNALSRVRARVGACDLHDLWSNARCRSPIPVIATISRVGARIGVVKDRCALLLAHQH